MTTPGKLRDIARKNLPSTDGLSREVLEVRIASITNELRGPWVSPGERIALNEERHVYREALSKAGA